MRGPLRIIPHQPFAARGEPYNVVLEVLHGDAFLSGLQACYLDRNWGAREVGRFTSSDKRERPSKKRGTGRVRRYYLGSPFCQGCGVKGVCPIATDQHPTSHISHPTSPITPGALRHLKRDASGRDSGAASHDYSQQDGEIMGSDAGRPSSRSFA